MEEGVEGGERAGEQVGDSVRHFMGEGLCKIKHPSMHKAGSECITLLFIHVGYGIRSNIYRCVGIHCILFAANRSSRSVKATSKHSRFTTSSFRTSVIAQAEHLFKQAMRVGDRWFWLFRGDRPFVGLLESLSKYNITLTLLVHW